MRWTDVGGHASGPTGSVLHTHTAAWDRGGTHDQHGAAPVGRLALSLASDLGARSVPALGKTLRRGSRAATVEVVSPSSSRYDWEAKTSGYARAAVPFYLIIDPLKCEIALFSDPGEGVYRTVERAVPGATVRLGDPFGFEVEAAALLK